MAEAGDESGINRLPVHLSLRRGVAIELLQNGLKIPFHLLTFDDRHVKVITSCVLCHLAVRSCHESLFHDRS